MHIVFVSLALGSLLLMAGCSDAPQEGADKPNGETPQSRAAEAAPGTTQAIRGPMPIYVTPYYDSKGPQVAVGPYSEQIAKANTSSARSLSDALKAHRGELRPEAMFALAVRLYDLGEKDEAVYWFYTAQYRARLFASVVDPSSPRAIGSAGFELMQAYGAFQQLAGEYINGYGFGDLAKLDKTLHVVLEEGMQLPDFATLFPEVKLIPQPDWPAKNKVVNDGLSGMIETIKSQADSIRETRKKNGLDGKY